MRRRTPVRGGRWCHARHHPPRSVRTSRTVSAVEWRLRVDSAWWPLKEVAAMHSPRVTPRHRDGDPRRTALHGIIAVVVLASLASRAHAAVPDTLALRLPD